MEIKQNIEHAGGSKTNGALRVEDAPARLLARIETRAAYMMEESRRAIEAYFLSDHHEFHRRFDLNYFQNFHLRTQSARKVGIEELERFAPQWRSLVPPGPEIRAGLAQLLGQKYPLVPSRTVKLCAALGTDDPEVREAYQRLFHQPISVLFVPEAPAAGLDGDHKEAPRMRGAIYGGVGASPPATDGRPGLDAREESALEEAAACSEWVNLPGGETLFDPGDPGDSLYILISGRLRVCAARPAGWQKDGPQSSEPNFETVNEIGRGEMVGEMEVLTGDRRTTRVIATRDSELVRLPQAVLFRLAEDYPQVMQRVNQILASRLRQQFTGQVAAGYNTLMTFSVLPAIPGDPALEKVLGDFSRRLVAILASYGPALHISRESLEAELGPGMAGVAPGEEAYGRVTAWLNEKESRYRYVVYQADFQNDEWARRALRQSDRALLVAQAGSQPDSVPLEPEDAWQAKSSRLELVLLHPPGAPQPRDTRRWLDAFDVSAHHHVRQENTEDLQRLARRLTGRSLGLVLSGGGARGFAHIGVLKALHEAGFQVDVIGGSSMGAILGAAYAMGFDDDGLIELVERYASPFKLLDPTIPVVSFFSSDKVSRTLQEIFGPTQIEDLWRPFFAVSSSLRTAQVVEHRRGSLWKAVRASSAIPGIFSPLLLDDDLLVDGAVLNNLPVDVMKRFNDGGPIIAVNVFPDLDLVDSYDFGSSVSGLAALFQVANPLSKGLRAPSIFENLLRVIALNDVNNAKVKSGQVDLYLRPQVEQYGILDFQSAEAIIAIGYRYAKEAIEHWRRDQSGSRLAAVLPRQPVDRLHQTLEDLENTLASLQGAL